ncbi:hypothetical protein BN3087_960003 [Sulfurovum sp. enrichment culture clone C5]|uniref:PKD domain-containing protein n=1 Tax=Sulfurovum sp. enrichment culture clone C5 TaxID=497650 RepID=A0A0S4XRT3_9BACT|nr:hypothetical protein BN3087_960003 [Sulfurovum sp. enrichment culture clone C5]
MIQDSASQKQYDEVIVTVTDGKPPVANAGNDQEIYVGDNATLDASQSSDIDGNIVAYEWKEGSVLLSNEKVFTKANFTVGTHTITLKVTDDRGNTHSDTVVVIVNPIADITPPLALITSPVNNTKVSLSIDIVGTASDEHLENYKLYISPIGKNDSTLIAEGNHSITNEVLGKIDASTLSNGLYNISLEATDINGQISRASSVISIEGQAKIGNFSFTVTDFDIQVSGMPVQVNRTYSTLQKFENLDFGYGWSIDYQNVKTQENIHPGKDWKMTPDTFIGNCFKFDKSHQVNISLPDGSTETFEYRFERECGNYFEGSFYDAPKLYALNGSEAKLEAIGASDSVSMSSSGEIIDGSSLALYNPSSYRLTMANGMVYDLNENLGITKITDLRGDTLTYSTSGIVSSKGESLTFERDFKNRITKITDLSGKSVVYHYDSNDNLDYVIDQMGYKTTYVYTQDHLLEEYFDPSGTRITKNIYDDSGRLIQTIDPDGNVVEFTHDINSKQEIIKDKLGRVSVFVYDESGNVLSKTNPNGETTSYTYDAKGNELSVTDPLGNKTFNTYDAKGNLLSTKNALGHTELTAYNEHNSPTTIADKNGNTMTIEYDEYNAPESILTPSGAENTFEYDDFGNKESVTNEYGETTTYEYDSNFISFLGKVSSKGNLLKETHPNGLTIEYTYDDSSNLLTKTKTYTNSSGVTVTNTTLNTYDAFNRLTSTKDEHGNITTYSYDARGNKIEEVDARGNRTQYAYSTSNKLILTTYADGTTESKSYDAMGNLLSQTNRDGETTGYEYDKADRLTSTIYPDGSKETNTYDAAGRVVATIDRNGNQTSYEYDVVGNKISQTDPMGNKTTYTYDAQGNMLSLTNALNQIIKYEYNALNQRIKTIYPDNTITQEPKNISGLPLGTIDENGNEIVYEYDTSTVIPLLAKVILPNGAITSYSYDKDGNKIAQSDALEHTTTWSYTDKGEILNQTLPLGQVKTFTYDAYGRASQISDYAQKTTKFIYDANNNLVKIEYADGGSVTYDYTPSKRVKTLTSLEGAISNTYDANGRLKTQTNPNNESISYEYDNIGNITKIITPTATITKTYDTRNLLSSVTDDKGTTNYTYDALGRQSTVTYPNGVVTTNTYNVKSQITNIEHKDSHGVVIQSFAYTLDNVGNKTKVVENTNRTTSYEYNNVNQLIKEIVTNDPNNNNTTTTFEYDLVGNLITKTINGVETHYVYNDNDQLISEGTSTFAYDANGNLITKDNISYSYDAQDRLVKVQTPTDTTTYTYDANNNRIAQTINNQTTSYLVDTNTPYANVITQSKGGVKTSYTYGNDLLNDNEHYFLTDALGSTRALSDASGTITDTYSYTPYGELSNHTGSSQNNFLFAGEQFDSQTGEYYLRARYYNPSQARFISRDTYDGTLTNPITQNHYAYANANPMMYTDPSGRMSMISVTFNMSVMNSLNTSQLVRVQLMRQIMQEAGCFVIEETLDLAIREGIYMWVGSPGVYVGKSNVDIDARIRDHVKKRFKGAEKQLQQLMRINIKLPPKLLETMEQAIMDIMGDESANRRPNYSPNKPKRLRAYEKYKTLLKKICKGK